MQTKRSHVAEIARQGLWASLTGGWYYEPANSLFCNTGSVFMHGHCRCYQRPDREAEINLVHLYIWLTFFSLPMLLGVAGNMSGTGFYWPHFFGYITIVFFLFVVLKAAVLYLHRIFDR